MIVIGWRTSWSVTARNSVRMSSTRSLRATMATVLAASMASSTMA